MRFDDATIFHEVKPPNAASNARQHGFFGFMGQWFSMAPDYCKMYPWWVLALSWIMVVPFMIMGFFMNPPGLSCLMSKLKFELDADFPASGPDGRMAFAKKWYSTEPRSEQMKSITNRFTFFDNRCVWLEMMAPFWWMPLPPVGTPAVWDEDTQQWHMYLSWWNPHILGGWVIVGERPNKQGWMIKGELEGWIFLKWMYRFTLVRCLEAYVDQVGQVKQEIEAGSLLNPLTK